MEINGTKVVDATKPLEVTITAKDVAKGKTKDAGACAAALAVMRQCHASAARVHVGRTYVKMDDKWVRFETPPSLRAELIAFDRGGSFEPGKHTLKKLRPSHFTGKRQGGADRNQRPRPPSKNRPKHVVTGIRQHGANR